jgi:hypothetical protein
MEPLDLRDRTDLQKSSERSTSQLPSAHIARPTGRCPYADWQTDSEVQLRLSDVLRSGKRLGDVVPRVPFAMHRVAGWPSRPVVHRGDLELGLVVEGVLRALELATPVGVLVPLTHLLGCPMRSVPRRQDDTRSGGPARSTA